MSLINSDLEKATLVQKIKLSTNSDQTVEKRSKLSEMKHIFRKVLKVNFEEKSGEIPAVNRGLL